MSSDLLAEFDSFYQKPQAQPARTSSNQQRHSFFDDLSSLNQSASSSSIIQPVQHAAPAGPQAPASFSHAIGRSNPSEPAPSQQQDADRWGSFEPFQSSIDPTPASRPRQSYPAAVSQDPWDFSALESAVGPGGFQQSSNSHQSSSRPLSTSFAPTQNARGNATHAKGWSQSSAGPWDFQSTAQSKDGSEDVDVLFDATEAIPDEDDFGDFESGEDPAATTSAPSNKPGIPSSGLKYNLYSQPGLPSIAPSKPQSSNQRPPPPRQRGSWNQLLKSTGSSAAAGKQKQPPVSTSSFSPAKAQPVRSLPTKSLEREDEWGDFIDSPSTELPPASPLQANITTTRDNASHSRTKSAILPHKILATTSPVKQDDPFDWAPTTQKTPSVSKATPRPSSDSFDWSPTRQAPPQPTEASRPSNVPPPSVILPLFPPLFDTLRSKLSEPLSSQSHVVRNRILSDSSTTTFLRGYLALATVAARIVAGRKLRWKRDTILAQNTRIGPARSGHAGGMKLTSVDKAENLREEREIADVVRVWKEQLGRLRAAVAASNASDSGAIGGATIPEIQESLPVKTLREVDGAVTAPQPCALCGLKRDERIEKVDAPRVEDSFGEWWVDYWGHTACHNFWEKHKTKLSQR